MIEEIRVFFTQLRTIKLTRDHYSLAREKNKTYSGTSKGRYYVETFHLDLNSPELF